MNFSLFLLVLFALAGIAWCAGEHFEERHKEEHGKKHEEKHRSREVESEKKHERQSTSAEKKKFEPSEYIKKFDASKLVSEKNENVFVQKAIEFYLNNPNTKVERECFAKFKPDQSIDFVIDVAPSPSLDKIDNLLAESPMALFLERTYRSASRDYFGYIQFFIDAVTVDMKPECTHSVIFDQRRKYIIRGRQYDDVESIRRLTSGGEFTDKMRNLQTLWPVPTKERFTLLSPIVKNNLGYMTHLALSNRDNGLPTVLAADRRSKPVYTIVISDGSSGATFSDLVGQTDPSRVTVIDIGNQRFVKNMHWDEMKKLAGVYTLTVPQQLPLMLDTVRNMACLCGQHAEQKY